MHIRIKYQVAILSTYLVLLSNISLVKKGEIFCIK